MESMTATGAAGANAVNTADMERAIREMMHAHEDVIGLSERALRLLEGYIGGKVCVDELVQAMCNIRHTAQEILEKVASTSIYGHQVPPAEVP